MNVTLPPHSPLCKAAAFFEVSEDHMAKRGSTLYMQSGKIVDSCERHELEIWKREEVRTAEKRISDGLARRDVAQGCLLSNLPNVLHRVE